MKVFSSGKVKIRESIAVPQGILCFISRIDVSNNTIDICDMKYAVKCKFVGNKCKQKLEMFLKKQPEDINILSLVGKQIKLLKTQICSVIEYKDV